MKSLSSSFCALVLLGAVFLTGCGTIGIFNNDAVLTSALLGRLLHYAETVLITGKSYRSKDQVEI